MSRVPLVLLVLKEIKVFREHRAFKVLQVLVVHQAVLVLKALRVLQVLKVIKAFRELRVSRVLREILSADLNPILLPLQTKPHLQYLVDIQMVMM